MALKQIQKIKSALRAAATMLSLFFTESAIAQISPPPPQYSDSVKLLEDVGGGLSVAIGSGASTFIRYFNGATKLLFESAVGFCILWFLIGGIQMILSGGDQGKIGEGKGRMIWSTVGLLALVFAGAVLRFLNSAFFT